MPPRSPEVKAIRVIVPFARPEHLPRVLENFRRQSFPDKHLVIVENGDALGACAKAGLTGVTVLTSEAHQASAKNVALEEIRRRGGGFFTTFDDDDWYGAEYLSELAGYAKSAGVIGKRQHFISVSEGSSDPSIPPLLLCHSPSYADQDSSWLTGGTISGFAEDACEFPRAEADDIYYCARMTRLGARLRALSIYHYLYRRNYPGARHVWPASRERLLHSIRGFRPLSFPLTPEGEVDLEIVSGAKPPASWLVLR